MARKNLATSTNVRFHQASVEAIPIPDEQINALRTMVKQNVSWSTHPFLKIGQRVRIRSGSLEGVEGVLEVVGGMRFEMSAGVHLASAKR